MCMLKFMEFYNYVPRIYGILQCVCLNLRNFTMCMLKFTEFYNYMSRIYGILQCVSLNLRNFINCTKLSFVQTQKNRMIYTIHKKYLSIVYIILSLTFLPIRESCDNVVFWPS